MAAGCHPNAAFPAFTVPGLRSGEIHMKVRSVCVYCGANPGNRPAYIEAARTFARLLAQRGVRLVYGGASVGVMGAVADAALEAGGEVVGVIPQSLVDREVAHNGLTELVITGSMHERKARMADLADAFVALPGGIGTLEEIFEIWTWGQLGFHRKPCGLLNVDGYYETLIRFLDEAVANGFVRDIHRGILLTARDGEELLEAFEHYEPPSVPRWVGRNET